MADSATTENPPTVEDAQAVATAAGEAATAEPTAEKAKASAAKAAKSEADKRGVTMSKEDAAMFADAVVDKLREMGAFDPPPEPVQPPPAPETVAPAPGEAPPPAAAQEGTGKKSFAQRYMGA